MFKDLQIGVAWFIALFVYDAGSSYANIRRALHKVKHDPSVRELVQSEVTVFILQMVVAYLLLGVLAGGLMHLWRRAVGDTGKWMHRAVFLLGSWAWMSVRGAIMWPRFYTPIPGVQWLAEHATPTAIDLVFVGLSVTYIAFHHLKTRPHPGWLAAFALGLLAAVNLDYHPKAGAIQGNEGPNVLIISFDAMRPDHLASNGYDRETTPALDAWMQSAQVFDNAYTPLARTWPAWTSILTGTEPLVHGLHDSLPAAGMERPAVPMITDVLKEAGYHTAFLTDDSRFSYMLPEHNFDVISQPEVGIRTFAPSRYQPAFRAFHNLLNGPLGWLLVPAYRYDQAYGITHRPDYFAEHIVDTIAEASTHERFFVVAHICLLHAPGDRPYPYHSLWQQNGYSGSNRWKYRSTGSPMADNGEWTDAELRKLERQKKTRIQNINIYDSGLAMVDDTWARIEQALEESGAWDNTLVIVISDHGEDFINEHTRYDYRAPNHGYTPWGIGQHQVVMAIRGPGFEGGKHAELVSLIDLAPTIAKYTGVELPSAQGIPLQDPGTPGRLLFGETGVSEDTYWPEGHTPYPFEKSHHRYTVDLDTTRVFQRPEYDAVTVLAKDRWVQDDQYWLVEENMAQGPVYYLFDWTLDPEMGAPITDQPQVMARLKTALQDRPFLLGPDGEEIWPPGYKERIAQQPPAPDPQAPAYSASISPLSAELQELMRTAGTWKTGCPVALAELSLLELSHHAPQDQVKLGQLIVATAQAEAMVQVFGQLYQAGFVIEKMQPAYLYNASDDAMMADNNTSAFNCRPVTGGEAYSEHSYGHALDLNPLWNPYVRGERVQPPQAVDYLDRQAGLPGMVVAGGPAVRAFAQVGWGWGGVWTNSKDYQHFSATGK